VNYLILLLVHKHSTLQFPQCTWIECSNFTLNVCLTNVRGDVDEEEEYTV